LAARRFGQVHLDQRPDAAGVGFGGAELEEEWLVTGPLGLELFEASPESFEFAPAHGPLFVDAVLALDQHIELAWVRQKFHLHGGASLLPGAVGEPRFQGGEPRLGRADHVWHRRIALTHFGQHFLGGNAAVHAPDAAGLAVLLFNLRQEGAQCGGVRRVADPHLIGQRKPFGRDDQRDDHLHAVGTMVATVAVRVFVAVGKGRMALEASACPVR
jgi:hypothetical protein